MIKDRLKKIRKERGLTQEEIAKHLNIARSSYSRYETGEREPDLETIKSLSEYYSVSTDFLLDTVDKSNNEKEKISYDELEEEKERLEKLIMSLNYKIAMLRETENEENFTLLSKHYKMLLDEARATMAFIEKLLKGKS